jgi:hypothetical protein
MYVLPIFMHVRYLLKDIYFLQISPETQSALNL